MITLWPAYWLGLAQNRYSINVCRINKLVNNRQRRVFYQKLIELDSNLDFLRAVGFLSGPLFLKLINFEMPSKSAWNYDLKNMCHVGKEFAMKRGSSKCWRSERSIRIKPPAASAISSPACLESCISLLFPSHCIHLCRISSAHFITGKTEVWQGK